MNKTELMKYAEAGVNQRLAEMQKEINELARLFPHLVLNKDGTVPAVLPLHAKNGSVPGARRSAEDLNAAIAAHLRAHPDQHTTRQIAEAVGVTPNHALKVAANVAHQHRHGKHPSTWTLKKHLVAAATKA